MAAASESVSCDTVLQAITAAVSLDSDARVQAEAALQQWETNSTPGFVGSLITIVQQTEMPQNVRLLAAIVAKNTVGSSRRKTMGTKEWFQVQEDEKAFVRSALESVLLSEPVEQIALQLALLTANVAQFDFPESWPDLLASLMQVASWGNEQSSEVAKLRALKTLKYSVRALAGKSPSINTLERDAASENLAALVKRRVAGVAAMRAAATSMFAAVRAEWSGHMGMLQQPLDAERISVHLALAKQTLCIMAEMIKMLPGLAGLQAEIDALFEEGLQHTPAIVGAHPELFVRFGECAASALQHHALEFRRYLPTFLQMFVEVMVDLPVDLETLQTAPKKLIIVTRFLARVLLAPLYQAERLAKMQPASEWEPKRAAAAEAQATINEFFTTERCAQVVQALVSKYLVLTPAELEEWQEEPEQAAVNDSVGILDAIDIGEAQSPRPCGTALFLCMIVRQPEAIATTTLALASELQAQADPTPDVWLLRDACYLAIGSGASKIKQALDFNQWYASELRLHLEADVDSSDLLQRVLQARSLWLIAQFVAAGAEMADETKQHALGSVLRFLSSVDSKVALTAVRVFYVLLASQSPMLPTEELGSAANAEFARQSLEGCFGLLSRLSEIECIVAVLKLLTLFVNHSGEHMIPHFGALAEALPQAWQAVQEQVANATEARAHGVMLTMVVALLRRLGSAVLSHEALGAVVFQLLDYSTSPGTIASQDSDHLLTDGMTLWYSVLKAVGAGAGESSELSPPLIEMMQRLPDVMAANREPCKGLLILEAYVMLGGASLMEVHADAVCTVVGQFITDPDRYTAKEVILAASVVDNLIQLFPGTVAAVEPGAIGSSTVALLEQPLRAMARYILALAAQQGQRGRPQGHVLIKRTFISVLCRGVLLEANTIGALCVLECGPEAEAAEQQVANSLIDHWLADTMRLTASQQGHPGAVGMPVSLLSIEGRREYKLVALALCALLGGGNLAAMNRLADSLRVIFGALIVEQRATVPPQLDLAKMAAEQGQLAVTQTQMLLQDPASTFGPSLAQMLREAATAAGGMMQQFSHGLDAGLQTQLEGLLAAS